MSTKPIALAAFAGGVGWMVALLVMGVRGGDAAWYDPSTGWIMMLTTLLGAFGVAGAMLGLVMAYQDTIRGPIAAAAAIAAAGGAISIFGPYGLILLLPLGSVLLIWELGQSSVFGRWLTWSHHMAAALLIVIGIVGTANAASLAPGSAVALALALVMGLYGLSWIAIGWTLLSAPVVAEETA